MVVLLYNPRVVNTIIKLNYPLTCLIRLAGSKAPDAIFLEKCNEVPIVVVTEKENVDMIGPPDPVSNLRPIIRRKLTSETNLQRRLRNLQDETQDWNQKFWAEHNTKFIREKEEFVKLHKKAGDVDRALTADEMSDFYKKFLDDNWKAHVSYNFQWYKRNYHMLYLAFLVSLQNLIRKS